MHSKIPTYLLHLYQVPSSSENPRFPPLPSFESKNLSSSLQSLSSRRRKHRKLIDYEYAIRSSERPGNEWRCGSKGEASVRVATPLWRTDAGVPSPRPGRRTRPCTPSPAAAPPPRRPTPPSAHPRVRSRRAGHSFPPTPRRALGWRGPRSVGAGNRRHWCLA